MSNHYLVKQHASLHFIDLLIRLVRGKFTCKMVYYQSFYIISRWLIFSCQVFLLARSQTCVSSPSVQRPVSLRTWMPAWTPVTTSTSTPAEAGWKRTSSPRPALGTAPLTSYETSWRSSWKVGHLHVSTRPRTGKKTQIYIQRGTDRPLICERCGDPRCLFL